LTKIVYTTLMDQQPLPQAKEAILSHFIEVANPKALPQFCVDGRRPKYRNYREEHKPYLQSLGGSYHLAVLSWLMDGGQREFSQVADVTFTSLRKKGYQIGVHTSTHAHEEKSNCGFVDNLGKIITRLAENSEEIWGILCDADVNMVSNRPIWDEMVGLVKQAKTGTIPAGQGLIDMAKNKHQARIQTLEGEHQEMVAVINLKPNTTLDVAANQSSQAFNLDLWWVGQQVRSLGLDEQKSLLLSLGLYVATEMVLVEDKGRDRLPIIIHQ